MYSLPDLQTIATSVASSFFFRGGKEKKPLSPDQVFTLMMMAIADGKHPLSGLKDYDIVDGRPAKKTESMLRDLLLAGGSVVWHELSDRKASATFSHAAGGTVTIDWDIERAKKAGLIGKDVWQKYMRSMLRSRCVSEGTRAVYPAATGHLYSVDEMQDMADRPATISPSVQEPQKPDIETVAEKLAAEIQESNDLEATYATNSDVFARLQEEKPDYVPLMIGLLDARMTELRERIINE